MTPLTEERKTLKPEDARYAEITKEMEAISKEVEDYQLSLIANHADKFVSKVVKMSMEIKIPDAPKDDKGAVIDPMFQLNYYRRHFWDNTDLSDERIVNTSVFGQKVEQFFGKTMIIQDPDSILNVAIPFIDGLKKGTEVFRFVVDYLTNYAGKSNQMGMDKVYLNMVKRYYCARDEKGKSYAFWMPEEKIESACEDIDAKLKVVKGVVPPNVILQDTNDVWHGFMDIKADYTVLFFWDPDCGHCIKAAPKLQKLYAEKMKARGVEVFAVAKATGDDYEKWKAFIKKNQLTFINVGLTQKTYAAALQNASLFVPRLTTLESLNYATTYDLYATPRVILLDKDKKIVAKQLSIHQLEDILDHLQGKTDSPKLFPPDPEDEAH
jgi:peroxiredoxin/predicted small integral membrane protein